MELLTAGLFLSLVVLDLLVLVLDREAVDLEVIAQLSGYADAVVDVRQDEEHRQTSQQLQFVLGNVVDGQAEENRAGQRIEKPIDRLTSGGRHLVDDQSTLLLRKQCG